MNSDYAIDCNQEARPGGIYFNKCDTQIDIAMHNVMRSAGIGIEES